MDSSRNFEFGNFRTRHCDGRFSHITCNQHSSVSDQFFYVYLQAVWPFTPSHFFLITQRWFYDSRPRSDGQRPPENLSRWSRYINYAEYTADYCSHLPSSRIMYYTPIISVVHVINIRDATLFIITVQEDLTMRAGNFSCNTISDNKRDKKADFHRQAASPYLIHYRFDRSSSSIRNARGPGANETAPEPLRSRLITIGIQHAKRPVFQIENAPISRRTIGEAYLLAL